MKSKYLKLCKRIVSVFFPTLLCIIVAGMTYSSVFHKKCYMGIFLSILMFFSARSVIIALIGSTRIDEYALLRIIFLFVNAFTVAISWLLIQFWDTAFYVIPIIYVFLYIVILKTKIHEWKEFTEIISADPFVYYTLYIINLLISVHT